MLLLAAVIPVYTWHEDTSGFLTDDGLYLLMADFFSPYYDGNIFVDFLVMEQARFPPVFPILIALLGGGSWNMGPAHLATGACFLLSALMLFLWIRRTLPASQAALGCLLVYALLPETLIYVLELRSEFLYIALTLTVLFLLQSARRSENHQHELLCGAAALVGLCIGTRTIGVCLFAAFAIHLFLERTKRKTLYLALAAAPPVFWYVIKTINGYSNFYVRDMLQFTTGDGAWQLITNDIPRNAWLMLTAWGRHFGIDTDSSWILQGVAALLLLLAIRGFWHRIRAREPDTYYVIFYILIIAVWPYPDHIVRFVYPLIPIALLYIFTGASRGPSSRMSAPVPFREAGLVFVMLILIYPNAIAVLERFTAPTPSYVPEDYRHIRTWLQRDNPEMNHEEADAKSSVVTLLKRVDQHLDENECLYAEHRPLTMLYSHRPVFGLPSDLSPGYLSRCKYLFVMNLVAGHKAKYPLYEIDHDRLQLVDIEYGFTGEQHAYLFRIRR